MKTTPFTLEAGAQILIRCFWLTFAVHIISFLLFAGGAFHLAFNVIKQFMSISQAAFEVLMLGNIMLLKAWAFIGFLFPYFAIRMVMSKQNAASSEN